MAQAHGTTVGAVETANQIPQSWLIQAANAPVLQWVFQRNLERVLYGRDDGGSTGPIWKILNATGMGRSAMHVSKAAVTANQLTQGEFGLGGLQRDAQQHQPGIDRYQKSRRSNTHE